MLVSWVIWVDGEIHVELAFRDTVIGNYTFGMRFLALTVLPHGTDGLLSTAPRNPT